MHPKPPIKYLFLQCGKIKEVRLMKSRGDKSKGFAYVEFHSEEATKRALTMDRSNLFGRPMFVSECNKNRDPSKPKLKVRVFIIP